MKIKFIDSIRGIAILMVILVHTSQKISGSLDNITEIIVSYGQMGVQLFFIVSAYTLCLSSYRRDGETLPLIKFGIRRYFRIAPTYYLGLIIYFIISLILSKFSTGQIYVPDKYNFLNVISNLFFIHGFYSPANNIIVPGGWSIGTEMAFYTIFPILFNIARAKMVSIKNILVFVFLGIMFSQLCLAIISCKGGSISNNSFWYYNIINQLPVFFIGIGYFFFKKDYNYELRWTSNLTFFIVLTLISVKLWYSGIQYFFSIIPIISGLSFVFLIELFQKLDFLNHKLLIRIGKVSFSMYLLHFIFAHLITGFLAPKFFFMEGTVSLIIFYLFSVLLTFRFALIFEKYIENPGVQFGRIIIKKIDLRATTR
jgi:peptidoglycan/LPS O-acetylase OafA/YrhL